MNRYQKIKSLINSKGNPYYRTSFYPVIPFSSQDIYVITGEGDRFDILADQYYGDSTLWWVISCANDFLPQNSLIPPVGAQIRIPINPNDVVAAFNRLNKL